MTAIVDFFCGIGGLANCLPCHVSCTGIDINRRALQVYRDNHRHRILCKSIESLTVGDLAALKAADSLWWMSPPCQPHTRRGWQRDLQDPRSAAFVNLVHLIERFRPCYLGMENVPEFAESGSHEMLVTALQKCGYHFQHRVICPTEFGWNNRRRRFYLIAAQSAVVPWGQPGRAGYKPGLEPNPSLAELKIERRQLEKYAGAVHVISRDDFLRGRDITRCFTSAYGRSPVFSGSWLSDKGVLRLFSPREILWQLGFPEPYRLPNLPCSKLWPLTGNSLSRVAVSFVLQHLVPDILTPAAAAPGEPPVGRYGER